MSDRYDWDDETKENNDNDDNDFNPRWIQDDLKHSIPRGRLNGFEPRLEISEKHPGKYNKR